jgi:hypothetical protein
MSALRYCILFLSLDMIEPLGIQAVTAQLY